MHLDDSIGSGEYKVQQTCSPPHLVASNLLNIQDAQPFVVIPSGNLLLQPLDDVSAKVMFVMIQSLYCSIQQLAARSRMLSILC